jgi:hypothetical protein
MGGPGALEDSTHRGRAKSFLNGAYLSNHSSGCPKWKWHGVWWPLLVGSSEWPCGVPSSS